MRYKKWVRKIVTLAMAGAILNVYANDINCSLNTDCVFSLYEEYMYIPTIEKADYKCHVLQKSNETNVNARGNKPVINVVIGHGSVLSYPNQEIELGGKEGNEGNLYFPSHMVGKNGKLTFVVRKQSDYAPPLWSYKIIGNNVISINCIKI